MERKEAIEIVRKLYNESLFMKKDKEAMVTLIPELAESEDKRIRNFISNELACLRATDEKGSDRYEELTKAIDWFEKQGEKDKFIEKELECIRGYRDEAVRRLNELEKQGEQKPAEWSEEDYNEIETIACHLDNINNEGMAEVLRSIRDKYYSQSSWKPSKEQIMGIDCAIKTLRHQLNVGDKRLNSLYDDLKKLMEE